MNANPPNTETAEMVEPEAFVITVRTMPHDGRPGVTRLRQLLKLARRACGLRCVQLAQADGVSAATDITEEPETP
jgi:hypothetical protein